MSQSGDFRTGRTSYTSTGDEYLRYYLIKAANSVM
ncbi:hypothetical protein [Sporolactobacillus shoreicorticis]|uniref:Uncharacterized protein n=1 Tax=Sporolactobacillus shoreicorticis TaxID=1923877 RepID=A0ABW5SC80_9BACL